MDEYDDFSFQASRFDGICKYKAEKENELCSLVSRIQSNIFNRGTSISDINDMIKRAVAILKIINEQRDIMFSLENVMSKKVAMINEKMGTTERINALTSLRKSIAKYDITGMYERRDLLFRAMKAIESIKVIRPYDSEESFDNDLYQAYKDGLSEIDVDLYYRMVSKDKIDDITRFNELHDYRHAYTSEDIDDLSNPIVVEVEPEEEDVEAFEYDYEEDDDLGLDEDDATETPVAEASDSGDASPVDSSDDDKDEDYVMSDDEKDELIDDLILYAEQTIDGINATDFAKMVKKNDLTGVIIERVEYWQKTVKSKEELQESIDSFKSRIEKQIRKDLEKYIKKDEGHDIPEESEEDMDSSVIDVSSIEGETVAEAVVDEAESKDFRSKILGRRMNFGGLTGFNESEETVEEQEPVTIHSDDENVENEFELTDEMVEKAYQDLCRVAEEDIFDVLVLNDEDIEKLKVNVKKTISDKLSEIKERVTSSEEFDREVKAIEKRMKDIVWQEVSNIEEKDRQPLVSSPAKEKQDKFRLSDEEKDRIHEDIKDYLYKVIDGTSVSDEEKDNAKRIIEGVIKNKLDALQEAASDDLEVMEQVDIIKMSLETKIKEELVEKEIVQTAEEATENNDDIPEDIATEETYEEVKEEIPDDIPEDIATEETHEEVKEEIPDDIPEDIATEETHEEVAEEVPDDIPEDIATEEKHEEVAEEIPDDIPEDIATEETHEEVAEEVPDDIPEDIATEETHEEVAEEVPDDIPEDVATEGVKSVSNSGKRISAEEAAIYDMLAQNAEINSEEDFYKVVATGVGKPVEFQDKIITVEEFDKDYILRIDNKKGGNSLVKLDYGRYKKSVKKENKKAVAIIKSGWNIINVRETVKVNVEQSKIMSVSASEELPVGPLMEIIKGFIINAISKARVENGQLILPLGGILKDLVEKYVYLGEDAVGITFSSETKEEKMSKGL